MCHFYLFAAASLEGTGGGISPGALYYIEIDEICFLFIVCAEWTWSFFTVLLRRWSHLSSVQLSDLIKLPEVAHRKLR